ncbi:MAG: hypothetical protein PHG89_06685 [Gallionella sp.]|nr:hypothetical protein [Gallionella sp.]
MKFEDCRKECIENCEDPFFKKMYSDYPVPEPMAWKKCTSKAASFINDSKYALLCMSYYEKSLHRCGIDTVPAYRVGDALCEILDGIVPWEIIKSVATTYLLKVKRPNVKG